MVGRHFPGIFMFQNGQTFGQQLIELAEAMGVAVPTSTGITLPSDAYELDKLKRKYYQGLQIIALSNPEGWHVLRPIVNVSLTTNTLAPQVIDGDISLYRLPSHIQGQPYGEWSWTNVAGSLQGTCKSVAWGVVTRLLQQNRGGSLPEMVAIRTMVEQTSHGVDKNAMVVRVYPRPQQEITLFAPFNVSVAPLVDLDQRHPFGPLFDPLVISAAKWAWVKDDTTDSRYQAYQAEFNSYLQMAAAKDNDNTPHTMGNLLDNADGRDGWIRMPSQVTLNGSVVSA